MDLFEFALKMELDGKAYYEKLASESSDAGLKTIFLILAADELKHCDTIKKIRESVPTEMANSTALETSRNLFQDLIRDKNIVESMKKSLDGYQHALKIEADSVRFYEEMAKQENNPESKQLLIKIANEERKHYNIMDNLYDYTLAPQNFLAWGEFSDLKEL